MSDDAILVEVALRDMRNLDVIKALDRLVILPDTQAGLKRAMADLSAVQRFILELPEQIQVAAESMFIEHARLIASHFRTHQGT